MPHVITSGRVDLERAWRELEAGPWRWGTTVAKVEHRYLSSDARALLVAGVVVEYGRPIHPVVMVTLRREETAVHLWPGSAVERTEAVKRFLVRVAEQLTRFGAGEVVATNVADLFGSA